jgi:hypothetical protein
MPNDTKIQDIAVSYVRKSVGGSKWPSTTLGVLHACLSSSLPLEDGELAIVSAFFSPESWYAFTTRRIVSHFEGVRKSLDPCDGIQNDFGNFKGYAPDYHETRKLQLGVVPREVATIRAKNSSTTLRFEFETGEPSMLPIYAARYWNQKHPFLDKLMTTAEHENFKNLRRSQG